jgi:uncharacterized membrane protein
MAETPEDPKRTIELFLKQHVPGLGSKSGQVVSAVQQLLKSGTVQMSRTEFRSGPIPAAEDLIRYNDAAPNAADRILAMAEKQQEHRIRLETNTIGSQQKQSARGQIIGGLLAALLIGAGTWLAGTGHDTVAGVVFGTTVIGLAGLFVAGRYIQKKDLGSK